MKKCIPFFITLILLAAEVNSQNLSPKNSIILSLGPSIPIGNYGSKNIYKNGAGFASTGGVFSLSYFHLAGKRIGFSASLQTQLNPLASSQLEKSFNDLYFADITVWAGTSPGQVPPLPVTGTKYSNWKFEKKSWWTTSLLIGAYAVLPISKDEKTNFVANLAFGPSYVSAPLINGKSIGTNASAYHEQSGGKAWGLGSEINIGLRRSITEKLFFQFSASHFDAPSISFKNITVTSTTTKGTPGSLDFSISKSMVSGTGKQSINSLNILFSLGFKL